MAALGGRNQFKTTKQMKAWSLCYLDYIQVKSMCHAVSYQNKCSKPCLLSHSCYPDEHMHWGSHVEVPNGQQYNW
jgi:hypothetical protein